MNPRVYVARKDCGCIVAAFPVNMDKAIKGELMKQFSRAGYDLEQTTQLDVRENYRITCDHNRPPLLAMMDERTAEGRMAIDAGEGITTGEGDGQSLEEEHSFDDDDGADQADVNALAGDITPEAAAADELLTRDEF